MSTQMIIQRKSTGTKWCDAAVVTVEDSPMERMQRWLRNYREPGNVYRIIEVLDTDWEE